MAKASASTLLHGKIGNLIYRVIDGRQFVQQAPQPAKSWQKQRIASTTNFTNYRYNLIEFAGAASAAATLYRGIARHPGDELGPIYRPYAQNAMIATLKRCMGQQRKATSFDWKYTTELTLPQLAAAFSGLDLSHPAQDGQLRPADSVRTTTLGPSHNPTSIKVEGLHTAAAAINPSPNSRLEFRIQIKQNRVEEWTHQPQQDEPHRWITKENANNAPAQPYIDGGRYTWISPFTDWAPIQVIPKEGFTLDLPQWEEGAKYATVIHIEWREHKPNGRRLVRHHKQGIARIVSIHGPAEAFTQPRRNQQKKITHHLLPQSIKKPAPQHQIDWRRDPQAYFQAVLTKLRR